MPEPTQSARLGTQGALGITNANQSKAVAARTFVGGTQKLEFTLTIKNKKS